LTAEGDFDRGARRLREGVALWIELDAPYEGARARILLAENYLAAGDQDRAEPELEIARSSFERLGATPDLKLVESRLAGLRTGDRQPTLVPTGGRVVRTLMFTDIVDSTRLSELLGDDAWNDLIRWHDETLRAIVVANGGVEVKSTGDGLFAAFEAVDAAIDAAIAIQRRLAAQRKAQGFAPGVRIGLHRAEVTQSGLDFHGGGVNLAARIGAAASGDEIVVSTTTLEAAGRAHPEIGRRTVDLKGISAPVDVATIDWR
jgi:class 3 adenylate cyclase